MSELLGRLMVADRVMATNYIMESMKQKCFNEFMEEWKILVELYHTIGYDCSKGHMDKICRELQDMLGEGADILVEIEHEIVGRIESDTDPRYGIDVTKSAVYEYCLGDPVYVVEVDCDRIICEIDGDVNAMKFHSKEAAQKFADIVVSEFYPKYDIVKIVYVYEEIA